LVLQKDISKIGELFPTSEIKIQLPESQQIILNSLDKAVPLSLDEIAGKIDLPTSKFCQICFNWKFLVL
jgi:hypothetical protein